MDLLNCSLLQLSMCPAKPPAKQPMRRVAPAGAPSDTSKYREGRWQVVASEAGPDGIEDWAAWEATARPPATYDPPQLRPGSMFAPSLYWLDWFTHRSGCCGLPVRLSSPVPCCCVRLLECACVSRLERGRISDPDEWFHRMLTQPNDAACPEKLRGIFWMRDNVAPPETLITFHDAEWGSVDGATRFGLKAQPNNWTHDPTCFGFIFTVAAEKCLARDTPGKASLRLEISPSGKWVHMDSDQMIYVLQEGDEYMRPDGTKLVAGDLMRLSFKSGWGMDTSTPVTYQYHVQRVAYLDGNRKLVKTAAYDELRANVLAPSHSPCWRMCWNGEQVVDNLRQLSDEQTWRYAPPSQAAEMERP